MGRAKEVLLPAAEQLEEVLAHDVAGRERDWAEQVGAALRQLEEALVQHQADCESPGGMFAGEVDLKRPSLVRQVSELRREHIDFLAATKALRGDAVKVAQTFAAPPAAATDATLLPKPSPAAGIPDFGALRKRGEELVAALGRHRRQENDLVLESVTTDLGAGD